jgi:hypothetical protein
VGLKRASPMARFVHCARKTAGLFRRRDVHDIHHRGALFA